VIRTTPIRRLTVRTDDGVELVPRFGHAESGATAPLVERIGRWASVTIDP
jgi:hypothetical protein